MTISHEKLDLAVSTLLQQRPFLSEMEDTLREDPAYLSFHCASTLVRVNSLLFTSGIRFPSTLDAGQLGEIIKAAIRQMHDADVKSLSVQSNVSR